MLKRIPLDKIVPNADQPRKFFESSKLQELANSIAEAGLKQPITVRPIANGLYEIVMGERRYRAHKLLESQGRLQESTILVHVRRMDDVQRDLEAIIENLQRADVTPLEEARAYQRMLDSGMELEALAKSVGVAQHRVTERTQLLKLAPAYLKLFETGQIDRQQAFEISRLDREADQTKIVQMISKGQLTGWKAVRAAVDAIIDNVTQADIFGEAAPKASEEDVRTVNRMEAKIETMARLAAAGWSDGECIVASKVSPDRARLMADKLSAMKTAITAMERELRMAAAQADVLAA